MPTAKEPTLTLNPAAAKGPSVAAGGTWQVHALAQGKAMATITALLKTIKADNVKWDLSAVDSMDHIGAQLFWNAWGKARPADLQLAPGLEEFFNRLETTGKLELPRSRGQRLTWVMKLGFAMLLFFEHMAGLIRLVGQLVLDLGRFARRPQRGPWKEISANIFHAGYQALGITALVGFLIGVVLSYLSAQQLHTFGGDVYLVNLLGMSIIRELGSAAGGDPGGRPLRLGHHRAAGRDARHRGTRRDAGDGHAARLPADHAAGAGAGASPCRCW
jgi:phospholipid/cholesterol/gamma-HCH transport system permease protein